MSGKKVREKRVVKRKETGSLGEHLAKDFLKKKGYRILETNYRCRSGEIDIVALDGDCLVFIEVRTKFNLAFGSPEESITAAKSRHLTQSAEYYCQTHPKLPELWRIDVLAIELGSDNNLKRLELIENAVEE
jgi:putative endonuclease